MKRHHPVRRGGGRRSCRARFQIDAGPERQLAIAKLECKKRAGFEQNSHVRDGGCFQNPFRTYVCAFRRERLFFSPLAYLRHIDIGFEYYPLVRRGRSRRSLQKLTFVVSGSKGRFSTPKLAFQKWTSALGISLLFDKGMVAEACRNLVVLLPGLDAHFAAPNLEHQRSVIGFEQRPPLGKGGSQRNLSERLLAVSGSKGLLLQPFWWWLKLSFETVFRSLFPAFIFGACFWL